MQGAFVESVTPGGPAAAAKIPSGAVIVAIAGTRIDTPSQLARTVSARKPGEVVEVTYFDGPQMRRTNVTLAAGEATETGRIPAVDPIAEQPGELQPAPAAPAAPAGGIGGRLAGRLGNGALTPADRPVLRAMEGVLRGALEGEGVAIPGIGAGGAAAPASQGTAPPQIFIPPQDSGVAPAAAAGGTAPEFRLPPPPQDTAPPAADSVDAGMNDAAEIDRLNAKVRSLEQRIEQLEALLLEANRD
jgi:hypothetical protein